MADAADITLTWNAEEFAGDLVLAAGDLQRGADLGTAVQLSLFTWRRANADDPLPDYVTTRMGWWGDTFLPDSGDKIGSRLWLLRREKLTTKTIMRARDYAVEALAWMVDTGVAQRVDVTPSRRDVDRLDLIITIYRTDGTVVTIRFDGVWQAIQQGA